MWRLLRLTFVFWLFYLRTFADVIAFFFAEKIFNMRKVLFFCLSNNVNTCYKEVLVLILSLSNITPRISLVVLDLFINLLGGKLLLLIKYVSRKDISRLIFSLKSLYSLFLLACSLDNTWHQSFAY